jgi:hypothetical protein
MKAFNKSTLLFGLKKDDNSIKKELIESFDIL